MKYYLYILQTVDDTLYCGIARDVLARFEQHLKGKGAKYTRSHKPQKLVYIDVFNNRSEASYEEYRIKKTLNKKEKLELIKQNSSRCEKLIQELKNTN